MTLYSNVQLCGTDSAIQVERQSGTVWVYIRDGNQKITMEARHVRALSGALGAFEQAEWEADHATSHMAVDAAEPAEDTE